MGNSQPTNRTGRKVTAQKLENAKKLGVLSLSEHAIEQIPNEIFHAEELRKLRTLDVSKNKLHSIGQIGVLTELKSLNVDDNELCAGSLGEISRLSKLQNLSAANNKLGRSPSSSTTTAHDTTRHVLFNHDHHQQQKQQQQQHNPNQQQTGVKFEPIPDLPPSIKQINLCSNFLVNVPASLCSANLIKLEKIDLSRNELVAVPVQLFTSLKNLQDLNLDNNMITSFPDEIGKLSKLKALSLRQNKLRVTSTTFTPEKNPQPLPRSLFVDTLLIDLNLHGNQMTNTQLNQFDGYQEFLDRRQKVKSKTMTNLDVCGLD